MSARDFFDFTRAPPGSDPHEAPPGTDDVNDPPRLRTIDVAFLILLCAIGIWVGSKLNFTFPESTLPALWPSNAILLAVLLRTPSKYWWMLLVGGLVGYVGASGPSLSLAHSILRAFFNCSIAGVTAAALRLAAPRCDRFETLVQLMWYLLIGVLVVPQAITAVWSPVERLFPKSLTTYAAEPSFAWTWQALYLANALVFLTLTPAVLLWLRHASSWVRAPAHRYLEAIALIMALCALTMLSFEEAIRDSTHSIIVLCAALPLLLWAAGRFGFAGVSAALVIMIVVAIQEALSGNASFALPTLVDGTLQIFLMALALPPLFLAVVMDERGRISRAIQESARALRQSYMQIEDLAARLITAQEAERARIARELHDDVGQQAAAISIALSRLKRAHGSDKPDIGEGLAQLQRRTDVLAERLRNLSHGLHPGVLEHVGLVAGLRGHCNQFAAETGIQVTFHADPNIARPSRDIALCLYRVTQEALRNVSSHSYARVATVNLLATAHGLELTISDDGLGFDASTARAKRGLGLVSVEERVRLVGGSLHIEGTSRTGGTVLRVTVPDRSTAHAETDCSAG